MAKLSAGVKAFREPDLLSKPLEFDSDFNDFDSRRLRYAIYWAFYENNVYRDVNLWAKQYRTQYALYKYTRGIYNPAYRLGEFWKSHLWGGPLYGDEDEQTALPIETENNRLIEAIEHLWRDSNWQINKDIVTLQGSIFGDIGIKVIDDTERGKVYLEIINPATIANVHCDAFGHVKSYVIEEIRANPLRPSQQATYREVVSREGDNVIYQTYLDNQPYDWTWQQGDSNGPVPEWSEPYGFVPMVLIQHNNVGLEWGWSELQAGRPKIHEMDDIASKLNDHIRKAVDPMWLFSGIKEPVNTPVTQERQLTGAAAMHNPAPGREEMKALYAEMGGSATALIANLDIASVGEQLKAMLLDLEEDYPELRSTSRSREASGEKSGLAIREARRGAEKKVIQRRANYDSALVQCHQMALAIGGYRNYQGYQGFDLDSFASGNLDHRIGKRPVFGVDPLDDIEIQQGKADIIKTLTDSGVSIEAAAIAAGFDMDMARQLQAIGLPDGVER